MAPRFFRDSFVGRLIYIVSEHRYLRHPEEMPDYVIPSKYLLKSGPDHTESDQAVVLKIDHENGDEARQNGKEAITNTTTSDLSINEEGRILVDWDSPDDPENPQNWPLYQKILLIAQVGLLTIAVYIGSSIYIPGVEMIMNDMDVGRVVAILPMSLFVIGYGIGPIVFSPLSEHPPIGRTSVYILTLVVFVVLQIPTALARDIGSLCVLRFIAGTFTPSLATGGASVGDVLGVPYVPLGLAAWDLCIVVGPTFGPFIGGIFVQKADIYWAFWFLLILSGAALGMLAVSLPETSETTLLFRKAQRLRRITGNDNVISQGHLQSEPSSTRGVIIETLWRPLEVAIKEPMVLSLNCYIGLVYAVFYIFFEAFPIVLGGIHQFNPIEQGVSFLSVAVGSAIGAVMYITTVIHRFTNPINRGETIEPETFMYPAIIGAIIMPPGLIIFAWTSSYHTHWMGTLVGAAIFSLGGLLIFQTMFNFLAYGFPRYIASVLASNGLFRAGFAAAFPLFANIMYENLGPDEYPVGWGCSILAGGTVIMIAIPVVLYKYGHRLRGNSKYAN